MSDAVSAIKDFLHAVDRGYLGQMPSGFNDSAFVKALRDEVAKKHVHRYGTPYQTEVGYARNCQMSVSSDEQKGPAMDVNVFAPTPETTTPARISAAGVLVSGVVAGVTSA